MVQETTKRKSRPRADRRHVVYRRVYPPTGVSYIGITAVIDRSPDRSVRKRWTQHLWHARVGGREGPLADLIRVCGDDPWLVQVVEVVKGKAVAHDLEMRLIRDESPSLNTEGTARKRHRGAAN